MPPGQLGRFDPMSRLDGLVLGVGVDIGGTKVAVGLASVDGALHHRAKAATPRPAQGDAVIRLVARLVRRELDEASTRGGHVGAVGVGTAGVVDRITGVVTSATETLPHWAGMDLRSRLQEAIGLPISIDNDVNAMAIAETRVGAGRGFPRCLVVAVGTGVGGALVRRGRVDHGATGTAGEIGHLPIGPTDGPRCGCGRLGHLEAYASGPAMHRRYVGLSTDDTAADFRAVVRRARSGDPIAAQVVAEGASMLGRAMGGLVNIFDPDAVVIGGGVVSSGSVFTAPCERALRAELLPGPTDVAIRHTHMGPDAGVIGAAILALEDEHRLRSSGPDLITLVGRYL